jgi:hypothetical protein
MTDNKTKAKEITRLVIVIPILLLLVAAGFYSWLEGIVVTTGDLGMDKTGRELFCQTLDSSTQDYENSDIRVFCRGLLSADVFSIELKDKSLIDLEIISPNTLQQELNKPYKEKLNSFDYIVLSNENSKRLSMTQLDKELEELKVKTYGDFLVACGFKKLILKNKSNNEVYFELELAEKYKTASKRFE